NGAVLVGFTLTNGATLAASDFIPDHSGGGVWCEPIGAVISNCVLIGNSAVQGGAAFDGVLNNCALIDNSATLGGGASCSILNNGMLTGNSARWGGGASGSTLNNCTLTANSATEGGGSFEGTLNNCIVYYNKASASNANFSRSTLNYSCTTPLPTSGTDNITDEPQLASVSHLSATSPCRAAGSAVYSSGVDIDGEKWADPPSIGCDEYRPGSITGALSVAIGSPFTNVAIGFSLEVTALIARPLTGGRWDFGGGTVISNRPYAPRAWPTPGDYLVALTAYNESNPGGVSATLRVRVVEAPVHYVASDSSNPVAPYDSWA